MRCPEEAQDYYTAIRYEDQACVSSPLVWLCLTLVFLLTVCIQEAGSQTIRNVTYSDLAPIFGQRCVMCHTGSTAPLGLRLDSYEGILKGSVKGAVVTAGDPSASELIRRIKGISQPRMPLTGPPYLKDEEIAMFERWVAKGAPKGKSTGPDQEEESLPQPRPGELVTYKHVAPIFVHRCIKCHTDGGLMGAAPEGYRLTTYEAAMSTADRVRIVPDRPEASELIRRIRGQSLPRMPFDGPPYLSKSEIELIEDWVAQGARNTMGNAAIFPTGAEVRLHGTLDARWRLDGLNLVIGSSTRIDKSPGPGDYVEVRGQLDNNGNVIVERLRRR